MPAQRYPLGRQDFPSLREENLVYVDKTALIYELTHLTSNYVFLSRPRRFGKTLLVSTLEAYFQGRRDLFEGLAINQLEQKWESRAVLRFDLSQVKETTLEGLKAVFDSMLRNIEGLWGITEPAANEGARLSNLVQAAFSQTGRKVVVLIDEYDSPILNVIDNPNGMLQPFREFMRSFYAPLKSLEPRLAFLFITGISKFSQLSLFSELNNINNVSMNPRFAAICGFTQAELVEDMAPGIQALADARGVEFEEGLELLKRAYDGYHFCWPCPDMYNPFSLLFALDHERVSNYWFESGTPTALVHLLQRSRFDPLQFEKALSAPASSFDAPTEKLIAPIPFMYQAGYLTIKGFDALSDTYDLAIPNHEVEVGLFRSLLPSYLAAPQQLQDSFLAKFITAVYRREDIDEALRIARGFFAAIPYDNAIKNENQFETALYLLFTVVGANVRSQVKTATGRVDLVWETSRSVYVMELKYDGTAEAALRQIDEKGYLIPWQADGRRIVKVGVSWSSAERTIAEGWMVR